MTRYPHQLVAIDNGDTQHFALRLTHACEQADLPQTRAILNACGLSYAILYNHAHPFWSTDEGGVFVEYLSTLLQISAPDRFFFGQHPNCPLLYGYWSTEPSQLCNPSVEMFLNEPVNARFTSTGTIISRLRTLTGTLCPEAGASKLLASNLPSVLNTVSPSEFFFGLHPIYSEIYGFWAISLFSDLADLAEEHKY